MEKNELLRLTNVSKAFSGNLVLKNIDFSIRKGEVRALVGENGAGKSTMIKIIAGAIQSDGGTISLDGEQVMFASPKESLMAGISVMYQELDLLPELTIAENIFLGIERKKRWGTLDWEEMNKTVDQYLQEMNITVSRSEKVKNLPIVIQQMAAAVKAMVHKAKIIIMDEPSSSLSKKELDILYELIRKLKKQDIAVIYVSHHLEEIFEICDSVTVLFNGQMVFTDDVSKVTKEMIVEKMVGKKVSENRLNDRRSYDAPYIFEAENISSGNDFNNITFRVKQGEIYGILGLMGSGVIELGKAVYGIRKISNGQIKIKGSIVDIKSPGDALRSSISYVSDERRAYGIYKDMDVETNGMITALNEFVSFKPLKLLNKKKMGKVFMDYVKQMEVKIAAPSQHIRYLSGGNQQKIMIIRTLASDTEIIILSCPTKGIDVGAKFEIYQMLLECVQKGKTVIVISQEITELVQICDRILMLKQGSVFREYSEENVSEPLIYNELLS